MDNRSRSAACVVFHEGRVLLGRHNYGAGKGLLIIPGGYVQQGEAPWDAAARETLEETGVEVKIASLVGMRFKEADWYAIFQGVYVRQASDTHDGENSEVLWINIEEALEREDVPDLTKQAIRSALRPQEQHLAFFDTRTRESDVYFRYFG